MTTKLLGILAALGIAFICAEVTGFLHRQGNLTIWGGDEQADDQQ